MFSSLKPARSQKSTPLRVRSILWTSLLNIWLGINYTGYQCFSHIVMKKKDYKGRRKGNNKKKRHVNNGWVQGPDTCATYHLAMQPCYTPATRMWGAKLIHFDTLSLVSAQDCLKARENMRSHMGEKHNPLDTSYRFAVSAKTTGLNIDRKRKEKEGAVFAQRGGSYCKEPGKNIATSVLLQNQNSLVLKNLWER